MNREHKMREALDLLLEVHDKPCRFDHNGYCQEHYLDHAADGCRVQLAREALATHPDEQVGLTDAELHDAWSKALSGRTFVNQDQWFLTGLRAVIAAHEAKRRGA